MKVIATRLFVLWLALGLGLAACGGKSTADAGADGTGHPTGAGGAAGATGAGGAGGGGAGAGGDCGYDMTAVVSGAITGTRTVPMIVASWSSSNDTSSTYTNSTFDPPFQLLWNLAFTGMLSVATYDETTPSLTCLITVTDSANTSRAWLAIAGTPGGQGTCSITFTAVTPLASSASSTPYCVHGSLRATLTDGSGSATGTVTLTASF